jgi:integrase
LYDTFTVHKPRSNNKIKLPTLEQLRQIWQQLPSIESKFYFALLAETGLRPGEPFLVSVEDLDLEREMIRIAKITETKRSFVAFLRQEFLKWIRDNYLPRRESFVKSFIERMGKDYLGVGVNAEAWAKRLIPFDQGRLRKEIKDVAKGVLGREFELYELRKFFATWMVSQGVPESIVNTLQGRAPPSEFRVLVEHYWSPRHEELRNWYLRFAPKVCC